MNKTSILLVLLVLLFTVQAFTEQRRKYYTKDDDIVNDDVLEDWFEENSNDKAADPVSLSYTANTLSNTIDKQGSAGTSSTNGTEVECTNGKSRLVTLLLTIFVGGLGVNYFYLGNIGLGVGKLIVTIVFAPAGGIWNLVNILQVALNPVQDASGCMLSKWN